MNTFLQGCPRPPHTFQTEKILTALFKSNLSVITYIYYHKKDCTYYIHKIETPNKSTSLSMYIFTHANSFANP